MSRTTTHPLMLIALAALALVIVATTVPRAQSTAAVALKAAMDKEVVDGDLKAAIEMYRKIAQGSDRAAGARALLGIGRCHEKLGNAEARKAYEQLVREYGDQADVVAEARARLAALAGAVPVPAGATGGLKLTRIYAGEFYASSISPDGTRLATSRSEMSSRDIWIRDIATGRETRLTNLASVSADPVWSPDSRWMAFVDRGREIKIVSAEGGTPRTVFTTEPGSKPSAGLAPTNWTSDSKKVVFRVPGRGLFAVPAAGGTPTPVCTFENPDEEKKREGMILSPDGRWIAYSAEQNGNTDIFIVPTTGQGPIRVTTNPAAERRPRWSPDGTWLAFASYSAENPQIWAVRISPRGEPEGPPVQVSKEAHVIGGDWTRGAGIGFSAAFRTDHVYTANADGTGETQLTQFASFNARPRWSPNGKWIAFRSDYRKPLNRSLLWTIPATGGTARLVSDKEVWNYVWSGDGEKLIFKTGVSPDQSVIYEVAALGGEPREMATVKGDIDGLSRSPDGRSLVFTFTIIPAQFTTTDEYLRERSSGIGTMPVGGGEPRILIPADKKGISYMDCSFDPDGKRIAYILFDYAQFQKEGMYSIWTMDMAGGVPRRVANGGEYAVNWSLDGKWLLFEKRIKDMNFDLYKIPAEGGEPVAMNIKGQRPEFSPDGKTITFSRNIGWGYEYWLAENVLPAQTGKAK